MNLKFNEMVVILALVFSSVSYAQEKVLTLRLLSEPQTLDWNRANTTVETHVLVNLMEGLLGLDEKLQVVPALAKSWKVSPDGKVYTFVLRQDVKWSDGVGLKAQDFVFSWKRLLTPATASPNAYFLFDIEGAEAYQSGNIQDFNQVGIQALDDYTLRVKLKHPVAYWAYLPTYWATFPLRQDLVEKHGDKWSMPKHMVTLGPYRLESHEHDAKIVLTANPNYFGKKGNVDKVVARIVADDTTALKLYETGELDFLSEIPSLELPRLKGRSDLKEFPYLKTGYFGFVTSRFPSSSQKFRQAVAMALDKSKLPELLLGHQKPASSLVPPPLLASKLPGVPFDPVRARALLKESGIDFKKPIQIDFLLSNTEKSLTIGQWMQGELKKNLGIQVTLQPFDNKTFRSNLKLFQTSGFILVWGADYPDPDNFVSIFLSNSGNNNPNWKNKHYDEMVLEARSLQDTKEREKLYLEIQNFLISDQAVIIPLYYEPNLALVRNRVKKLNLNPLNYLYVGQAVVD